MRQYMKYRGQMVFSSKMFNLIKLSRNKYQFSRLDYKILLMTNKHMIEREGIYYLDHLTGKTAINNLICIHETERHDSEPFFFQSSSEVDFLHSINSQSIQTKIQFTYNPFDGTIFQKSNSLPQTPCEILQGPQMMNSQNLKLPRQISTATSLAQIMVQRAVSEDGLNESSDSQYGDDKKGKKTKRSGKNASIKKVDKEKNIFPNIAKRNAKIMFDDCKVLTEKYLQKRNIKYEDFANQYKSLMDSNCSGLSLSKYFTILQGKEQMSTQFMKLFERYLRKQYMLLAMKRGKMADVENYILCKNRHLMYFSSYINSSFQRKK